MNIVSANIREHWDAIRQGLAEIALQNDAAWIPEDVYCMVQTGKASLFMARDFKGFAVLQVREDAHKGTRVMHIVAAYAEAADAQEQYMESLNHLATLEGCVEMEFDTRRKGFARRGGWTLDRIVYRKDVDYG